MSHTHRKRLLCWSSALILALIFAVALVAGVSVPRGPMVRAAASQYPLQAQTQGDGTGGSYVGDE